MKQRELLNRICVPHFSASKSNEIIFFVLAWNYLFTWLQANQLVAIWNVRRQNQVLFPQLVMIDLLSLYVFSKLMQMMQCTYMKDFKCSCFKVSKETILPCIIMWFVLWKQNIQAKSYIDAAFAHFLSRQLVVITSWTKHYFKITPETKLWTVSSISFFVSFYSFSRISQGKPLFIFLSNNQYKNNFVANPPI